MALVTYRNNGGSSVFKALKYDEESGLAIAVFRDGPQYAYQLSRQQFAAWVGAPSWGTYFNYNIRGRYEA